MKTKTKRVLALIGATLAAAAIVLFAVLGTQRNAFAAEGDPTVSGKWTWNDNLEIPDEIISQNINFTWTINGSIKNETTIVINPTTFIASLNYVPSGIMPATINKDTGETTWADQTAKEIDFGETPQEVSQTFYTYLTTNATSGDAPDPEPEDGIEGEYFWQEVIPTPFETITQDINFNFKYQNQTYIGKQIIINVYTAPTPTTAGNFAMSYVTNSKGFIICQNTSGELVWNSSRVIDFGDTKQEISEEFESFLNSYAKQATFENIYNDGYDAGESAGYDQGYDNGYTAGVNDSEGDYQEGYNKGYTIGKDAGLATQLGNPISAFIQPAEEFLNMKIFGTISIGDIINVMLFIAVGLIFLKIFAGG